MRLKLILCLRAAFGSIAVGLGALASLHAESPVGKLIIPTIPMEAVTGPVEIAPPPEFQSMKMVPDILPAPVTSKAVKRLQEKDAKKKNGDGKEKDGDDKDKEEEKEKPDTDPVNQKNYAPRRFAVDPSLPVYTLAQCIDLAHQHQPILKGLRASVGAAHSSQATLGKHVPFASVVLKDIEVRRMQAAQGVAIAEAELGQACHDVTYAVVRTYFTVVYAREQIRVTTELVEYMNRIYKSVRQIYKDGGSREINENTVDTLRLYFGQALAKKAEAEEGYTKAIDALREAMGIDPLFGFAIADDKLPMIHAELDRDLLIYHALQRRGEIQMAAAGANVLQLEAMAQALSRFGYRKFTAAAGSDVHSRTLPTGSRDGDYRPDTLGVEFPTIVIGNRDDRSSKFSILAVRGDAVLEKSRNLVALEAQNAHSRYIEATRKMGELEPAAKAGRELTNRLRDLVGARITYEQELIAEATSSQAAAAFNEALLQQLLALASIERVTAGGVRANYPGR